MKFSKPYLNRSSMFLLLILMTFHLLGTLVAYTIYVKFASLGDGYFVETFNSDGYRAGASGYNRTWFVHAIYHYVGNFLPDFWAPLAFGQIIAIAIWHAFRDFYLYVNRQLFWACNLFPHFLIWSGSSSKEQIVIIFGVYVIGFVAKHSFFDYRLTIKRLFFVCFSLGIICFIRPNYFLIYFTIFLTSLFAPKLNRMKIYRFSIGIWTFFISLIIMLAILFTSIYTTFFSKTIIDFMKVVETSFLSLPGRSNRYDIQWENVSDYINNSLWGVPQGFIGPTLVEAILRPLQSPVFLEGLVYLFILCYLFFKLFKLAAASKMLRVYILPYLFVAIVIVFISYPFLIFNPGAALRYKQALHPILFFYPLLILSIVRANKLIRRTFVEQR